MNVCACDTLLSHKRQRPGEHVHEVWQPVGVRGAVELSDIHHIVFILQHRRWIYTHTHTKHTQILALSTLDRQQITPPVLLIKKIPLHSKVIHNCFFTEVSAQTWVKIVMLFNFFYALRPMCVCACVCVRPLLL